ncbi:MAG: hypothetical protein M3401_17405 [Actinomycetota bacterium]|nr:hypothetical protein [Actinomycetota bacterium]
MSPARTRQLAWGLAALAVGLQLSSHIVYLAADGLEFVTIDIFTSAFAVAFSAVGVLVAMRQPGNAIGWIFLGVAVSTALGGLAHGFVEYRLQDSADPGALIGAAAAYADVSWIPFVLVPATVLLLLFPDGRLPSRRWRFVAGCACAGIVGVLLTGAMRPELEDFPTVTNPFASDSPALEPLAALSFLLILVGVVGSAASVVARFRRAGSAQRAQIKWLAAAGAVVAVAVPVMAFPLHDVVGEDVANGTIMFTVLGLPVAAGIAILRHRLYDIDVVINRTLVYGALTATLAGTYLGTVLLLQLVLSGATAGNGLAVAGSTLAVAALFQPARRRIQGVVDQRFFRRKYDAVRTLEAFGAHLRDQVDLDALGAELRGVVTDTMQPTHVSLWLQKRVR